MPGGTLYHWKYDENGKDYHNQVLEEEKHEDTLPENIQLTFQTEVTSDKRAEKLATVRITGNTSTTKAG